jgi:PASTA domain
VLAVALAGMIVGVIAGTLSGRDSLPERRPAPEVRETGGGIVVPEVAGLTAWEARDVLLTVDLRLARIVPVPGEPGVVVGTRPATGKVVGPGEAVTLLVGVEPDRLGPEE